MAGWRETDTSEPIDETPLSGASELPGRNGSERESSLVIDESQGRACHQEAKAASLRLKPADGWRGLGGVEAAAREQSVTEQLEKSFSPTGEIRCSKVGPITEREVGRRRGGWRTGP